MKNIVKLEYRNNTYTANNDVHPEFYNCLLQLFANGKYPDNEQFGTVARLLSLHPFFSGKNPYDVGAGVPALSSVAIYAFTKEDSALRFINDSISSEDITSSSKGLGAVSYYDYDNVNTYSITSIGDKSFSVSQSFYYSPTGESTFFVYNVKSFALKTNYLRRILPQFLKEYLPFTHITTKKLTGMESIQLNPAESFKISWLIDFDNEISENSTTLKSTINDVDAQLHDQLKIMLCDIMSSSSYTFPSTTADDATYFKIEGLIAFSDPTGALYNNGSTANGTAFYMTPESSSISITANNTVSYFVNYINNTGEPQVVGSLLLSGKRSSDVFSIVPISWISAKDLWGKEKRIIQPRERIEITWSIKINSPKTVNVIQQQIQA